MFLTVVQTEYNDDDKYDAFANGLKKKNLLAILKDSNRMLHLSFVILYIL